MPSDTPDQQITLPVDADAADNPVAFNQSVGDIEPRLVRRYTTSADRTARMLTLNQNDLSSLTAPTTGRPRIEAWDGVTHVSAYVRCMYTYARKAADETVNNSTALQNDDLLFSPLAASSGTYQFELNLLYSATTVADIKFAFTWPAGATAFWSAIGLATGSATLTGDATFSFINVSGTSVAFGGIGAGAPVPIRIFGNIAMGGTAGNLQLQWAQQNLEATNTVVHSNSNLQLWRVS